MSKYTIKTTRKEDGEFYHQLYDDNANIMNPKEILGNNKSVSDILDNYHPSIVPFLKKNKLKSASLEVEVL